MKMDNRIYDGDNNAGDEIWMPVEGFEGLYEVSNTGQVKALERLVVNNGGLQHKHEKILRQNVRKNGYCMVVLCKDGITYPRMVHRLVAAAFIPNPECKPVVDHIDTDATNNHVENLRWVLVKENANNPLTRLHISQAKMGHPYWGRPLTADEREKIRQALLGRKATPEMRKHMSEARKNSPAAIEASRANLKKAVEANRGKQRSEETRAKISQRLHGVHKGKKWRLENGKRVWYDPICEEVAL